MKATTKRVLSIFGTVFIVYFGFVTYVIFAMSSSLDEGSFSARKVEGYRPSNSATVYAIKNGELILDNRGDTLSPMLSLKENGEVKWSLDLDVRDTKGYEETILSQIDNVDILRNTNPIKIRFSGLYSKGQEVGYMKINRKSGANRFCFSW